MEGTLPKKKKALFRVGADRHLPKYGGGGVDREFQEDFGNAVWPF